MNFGDQPTFQKEWKEFFGQRVDLKQIEKSCLNGKLRVCHVRSIVWRILLRSLPLERNEWCVILSRTRSSYAKLKSRWLTNPRDKTLTMDPNISNPLSLGEENPWQQYFADSKLRECISCDVERTFPELEYFKANEVRSSMIDILFIYAKQHPDIAYRQGMHEILATLIFVLNYDQQAFSHLMEQNSLEELPSEELKILSAVNDPEFLEHDSFEIFSQLMMMLERWYLTGDEDHVENSNIIAKNNQLISSALFTDEKPKNELIVKLQSIMDDILAVIDPALYQHLSKMQISPQIYGIRWLRLLFGREFPIHDLLFVWDAIFAYKPLLSLVDYIFVAMLEYIRHLVINEDYSTTLQYLMRYPPVADAHSLIQYALHIKSPKKFEEPRTLNVTNFENITIAGAVHPNRNKDVIKLPTVMGKLHKISSPERILANIGDSEAFVTTVVDTISDHRNSFPLNHSGFSHTSTNAADKVVELLQEQVSCLQSRLNDMDMMALVMKQKISSVVNEQIPKIIGNENVKKSIKKELHVALSEIDSAIQLDANSRSVMRIPERSSGRIIHDHNTATFDRTKSGNEGHMPVTSSQCNYRNLPSNPRRPVSRMETEMRVIRPRSSAR
ncbi:unnamed protein product [Thelazia callipaeda]|uniref:Rab-GAP TBC domain-containing protein n=1 Tax=Thelazia callipaeda TaxID=103827 RepID=A0A0N5D9J3_THECL|nr:unnamed protein product [Thelazia callipaeda]